jgi:hypothetical protein
MLDAQQSDGTTLRAHAQAIAKGAGQVPEEYQSLPFPEALSHCWHWFIALSRSRSSNGFGANPISYNEIVSWSDLTGVRPDPIEVQAIISLDAAYMSAQAEEMKKRSAKHG